jgi:hypothetical protein
MLLEDPRANHRYFVPELGVARGYRLTKGELCELTPVRLAAQLRGVGVYRNDRRQHLRDQADVGR